MTKEKVLANLIRIIKIKKVDNHPIKLGKYQRIIKSESLTNNYYYDKNGKKKESKIYTIESYSFLSKDEIVQQLVATKYSIYDELAIQRQRYVKLAEFEEYNNFVEQCKVEAQQFIDKRKDLFE